MAKLLDNQEAAARTANGWIRVSIEDAIRAEGNEFRCIACHAPMKAVKKAATGQRAHFAHIAHTPGCPRGEQPRIL